jgi:hypothetical protein
VSSGNREAVTRLFSVHTENNLVTASLFLLDTGGYLKCNTENNLVTASLFPLDTGGYLKCNAKNNLVTASLFLLDTGGYLQCHTEKIIVFQYSCSGFLLIIGL